jgi:A/G-specific adenine glycosylase
MPLDANIERILARLYALNQPLIKVKKKLSEKAQLFLSKKYSSNLIQSFMDYGSIICTPRNPNCSICEIKKYCLSYQKKIQNTIPVKVKKTTSKLNKFSRAYILINEKNEILVRKRASKGMLASMLEVPNDDWVEKKSLLQRDVIVNEIPKKLIRKGDLRYSFSHFDLYVEIFYKKIRKIDYPKNKWLNINKYSNSQLPTVMKKILEIVI